MTSRFVLTSFALMFGGLTANSQEVDPYRFWSPDQRVEQLALENALYRIPSPDTLRASHDLLCAEPHIAGSKNDQRMISKLVLTLEEIGVDSVEQHDIWVYLARPIEASVQVLIAADPEISDSKAERIDLPIIEQSFPEDPFTHHRDLLPGWNAYSGSGDVTSEIVYANHGTKEDFEKLRELNVDLTGHIVIARYGGNFRGYKAKFAEEAGAAGLLIYTDPDDAGWRKGLPWPEGGWANESYIQRGSIKTLPWSGDPLTPGVEATEDAQRLDPTTIALPTIPVQPIGWAAANAIMSRMTGPAAPREWQGGLPFTYRITGGELLNVRLKVIQKREIMKTANVIGRIEGSQRPDELVIIGCHFDAWTFGAADPHAGSIVVLECARSFVNAVKQGFRPARTILFANWGAEEFGIIGSTEWCEAYADQLGAHAVAYINLDAAAMGPNFSASCAPSLKALIADAAHVAPQPGGEVGQTVFDQWISRGVDDIGLPNFGNLGGGSDHIGFYCHLGIPSVGLGAHGSDGTAYHSNYDNLTWYRRVVGEDYESARMLTRITNMIAARLANAALLPIDPVQYARDTREHLKNLMERSRELELELNPQSLIEHIEAYESVVTPFWQRTIQALSSGDLNAETLSSINRTLLTLERDWLSEEGLYERPWFGNLYAASDPFSGYASWMLPNLRWAIEEHDPAMMDRELNRIGRVFTQMQSRFDELTLLLDMQPIAESVETGN